MFDLASIGVTATWEFVFKPILEELAGDSVKDLARDLCDDSLRSVFYNKDEWKKASARALKEFLVQFEQELIGAGLDDSATPAFTEPLRRFTSQPEIRLILGAAVTDADTPTDFATLARLWREQKLERLPDDFDWSKLCRRYQNKVRGILRESPELRAILDSKALESGPTGGKGAGVPAGFDTSKYGDGLRKRYGYLKLESLDANPDHQRIALSRVFVEQSVRSCQQFNPRVYELPIEHRRRLREKGGQARELQGEDLRRQRDSFLQQSSSPVLEVLADPRQRLSVVLGDPGSGKSVLLEYLALRWAEAPPAERSSLPLPLLIELKAFAENFGHGSCRSFLEYCDHGSGTVGHLDQRELDVLLQRGNATLLLDGLDEIFDLTMRQQIAHDLVRLTTRYPLARFVVTSRIIGYDLIAPILRNAGFQHFLLQDLDERQQETFIRRWHALAYVDPAERAEKAGLLRDAITGIAAIRELAQNPLLLTLTALLNRHQELPRDRNELYESASKLMLQQWDASRALRDDPLLAQQSFDFKDKQAMLRAVAFRMQTSPAGLAANVIAADDLEQTLVDHLLSQGYANPRPIAGRLIQQLRERNFILCLLGDDFFAFVHRTFLEFFCAWAWVWKFEKEKTLTVQELQRQTFDPRWADEKWHEVLRLIVARLEPQFAAPLIEGLLNQADPSHRQLNIFVAARCFSDVRNSASLSVLSGKLANCLKPLVRFDLPYYYGSGAAEESRLVAKVRADAVHHVANCWPKAAATRAWLEERASHDESPAVRQSAVWELARGWKTNPRTQPLLRERARLDEQAAVRQAAYQELARNWTDAPETLPSLKDCVATDRDREVRRAIVHEIAIYWRESPDTLLWLKERAQSDSSSGVRQAALREIARGWPQDLESTAIFKQRALADQDGDVRQTAVQEVARIGKDQPDTLAWLKETVRSDEAPAVRQAALWEVARRWSDSPETLSWLKYWARADKSWSVRQSALKEIVRGWKDDSETLPWLKERARLDEDDDVRRIAVREIARAWNEDPNTLSWLKHHARSPADNTLRRAAVWELVQYWKDDDDTLPFLKERAVSDEVPAMRSAAVREIARGWQSEPQTAGWLKLRARQDNNWGVRQAAVQELARGWRDQSETLVWLKDRAAHDDDGDVRQVAVRELARQWKDQPDLLPWLKERAARDESPAVRWTALREIARGWSNLPDTPLWLGERAVQDEDNEVKQIAVWELDNGWRTHPEAAALLQRVRAQTT